MIPLFSRERPSTVTKAVQKMSLLSDDTVSITVVSAQPIDFDFGDLISVFGKPYKLNQLPEPTKEGERSYTYSITLEGIQYDLIDAMYLLPETCYGENYYGNLGAHLGILKTNLDRVYPNKWIIEKDYTGGTECKNLNTDGKNCLQALQELCDEYDVEFTTSISSDTGTVGKYKLTVKNKVGGTFPATLEYGRGKGLYKLQRKNVNNAGITTKLYVYGSSDNLGSSYRHTKLCLSGKERLESYLTDADAVSKYGVKENVKTFEDIKPERVGTVSAVSGVLTFQDKDMDFDLNERNEDGSTKYLITDTTAKITFQTGGLAGYSFDVHSYDHSTKQFTINKFTDENGMVFPSETSEAFQIKPTSDDYEGDTYIIEDITLPDEYITKAESKLRKEGEEYLAEISQPQVSYSLELDENFFIKLYGEENPSEVLHVGDAVKILDNQIGVSKEIRITSIERDLLKAHAYTVELSDTVTKTNAVRVLNEIQTFNEIIKTNSLADPAIARRNWKTAQELQSMVFDPDGDYYSEKIKPLSIDTTMLSVGAKSQQFVLKDVIFEPNYTKSASLIHISAGTLEHYAIADDVKTWNLSETTLQVVSLTKPYYIYAKCEKEGTAGAWYASLSQKKVNDDAEYYYFLVGMLGSADYDTSTGEKPVRPLSLTYGFTTINGRYIKTGRIESTAGSCYFDLDNNEIGGVIKFVKDDGSTGSVSELGNDLKEQIDGKIETWYQETAPSWTTASEMAKHKGDLWFNTSTNESWRYDGAGNWTAIYDKDAKQALSDAAAAQRTANGKRQVFTNGNPIPPYSIGDLWIKDKDLYVCNTERKTGSYTASDFVLATKYTDNEGLNTFANAITTRVDNIEKQIDGKIETWFLDGEPTLTNAPASDWTTDVLKKEHLGDLYYNNLTGYCYRFSKNTAGTAYAWYLIKDSAVAEAMAMASKAQDTADGKRRVFLGTDEPNPSVPYDRGDLWVTTTGDLMVCKTARTEAESYVSTDWDYATNYTNNDELYTFINGQYAEDLSGYRTQLDGKLETWYQTTDPSSEWTTDDVKKLHLGDMWFNTDNHLLKYYAYSGTEYKWEEIHDKTAIEAAEKASEAYGLAGGKTQTFVDTPTPPYNIGDLWIKGDTAKGTKELWRCVEECKEGGTYSVTHWTEATTYDNTQTVIDGGIVTAGTIRLANAYTESIMAGITGGQTETAETAESEKVRIWAGSSDGNKTSAPFRVLQDGSLYATKAVIEGTVKATDGEFNGKVSINGGKTLLSTDGSGQLANGNVSWDKDGNVTLKDITADSGIFTGEILATRGIFLNIQTLGSVGTIDDSTIFATVCPDSTWSKNVYYFSKNPTHVGQFVIIKNISSYPALIEGMSSDGKNGYFVFCDMDGNHYPGVEKGYESDYIYKRVCIFGKCAKMFVFDGTYWQQVGTFQSIEN